MSSRSRSHGVENPYKEKCYDAVHVPMLCVGVRVVVAALFVLFRLFCEPIGSVCCLLWDCGVIGRLGFASRYSINDTCCLLHHSHVYYKGEVARED